MRITLLLVFYMILKLSGSSQTTVDSTALTMPAYSNLPAQEGYFSGADNAQLFYRIVSLSFIVAVVGLIVMILKRRKRAQAWINVERSDARLVLAVGATTGRLTIHISYGISREPPLLIALNREESAQLDCLTCS
jgi:hypothetical protein